jgi:NhaP-type Na+/H+ or K+/H+ antiporter
VTGDIAILAIVVVVFLLGTVWLSAHRISMPMVFVAAGLLLGPHGLDWVTFSPTAELGKEFTELTLGLLLFADASTLPARRVAREGSLETRLLGIGLPLSIALGALLAYLVYPDGNLGLILLLGAALAPTDAALGLPIFSNRDIPSRIRLSLNVESGLNDGIATPFVTLFITLAVAEYEGRGGRWLHDAVGDIAIAVVVGVAVGIAGGWLIAQAVRRGWTSVESSQVAFLFLALVSFFGSQALGGNGFIAAFVGGLLCSVALGEVAREAAEYTETTGTWMSYLVWMLFGASFVPLAVSDLFSWRAVVFGVLALTAMRLVPVALAMIGTGLRPDSIAIIGWFGPRGLASVVFLVTAIIAFEEAGESTDLLIAAMTWTILLSVILHGTTAGPLGAWYGRRLAPLTRTIPEFLHDQEPETITA